MISEYEKDGVKLFKVYINKRISDTKRIQKTRQNITSIELAMSVEKQFLLEIDTEKSKCQIKEEKIDYRDHYRRMVMAVACDEKDSEIIRLANLMESKIAELEKRISNIDRNL